MAKKDETTMVSDSVPGAIGGRARADVSVVSEIVLSVVDFNEAALGTTLRALGALSTARAKIAGRTLDMVEATVQDVVRVARDASQGQAELEAHWLTAVERVIGSGIRRVGGAFLAIASVADPRTAIEQGA